MARTVRIPCGVAVMQVLAGKLPKGLLAPNMAEICDSIREELLKIWGIGMLEKTIA